MRRGAALFVAGVLGVLCLAPTPGDVGGCGTEPTALEKDAFARERKQVDCDRCRECALRTNRCARACDATIAADARLPRTCEPLAHDGRVCIRALRDADCEAYAGYVADVSPSTPGECRFCRIEGEPEAPTPGFDSDAGREAGLP